MYSICVSVTLCFVSGRQGEFGTCQFVSKLRGKIKGINLSVDKNSELLRVALGPPGHLSTSGTSSGDGVGPASLGEGTGHLEGAQCLPAVTVWNWGTSPPNPALLTFLLERKATQANQEAGAGLPAVLPETEGQERLAQISSLGLTTRASARTCRTDRLPCPQQPQGRLPSPAPEQGLLPRPGLVTLKSVPAYPPEPAPGGRGFLAGHLGEFTASSVCPFVKCFHVKCKFQEYLEST